MYKMLVVDDEYLVLMGIRETIDWAKHNIEIVGEASNGLTGFNLAMELKPDIIISDVKMPVLNGLGLVEKLKDAAFDGAIIILSGYKDFEYAKKAFESGVYSYLLKPIDNDELLQIVVEALNKLEKNRENAKLYQGLKEQMPLIKSKVIKDILEGNLTSTDKIEEQLSLFSINIIRKGFIIYGQIDNNNSKTSIDALNRLYMLLLENLSSINVNLIDQIYNDHFVIMIETNNQELIHKKCEVTLKSFEKEFDDIFSIGISKYFEGVSEIKNSYILAANASKNKLFSALNTISFSADNITAYKKNIVAALDIIAQRYSSNLTVSMVAEELYVSESYLMHLFKDNLGKTFNECLTNYRIMIAKKLLLQGKYRINEIAELVGYSDVKYFGQVFRKQVGCTPSDFIKESL